MDAQTSASIPVQIVAASQRRNPAHHAQRIPLLMLKI
jgi:hypothetical protein